MSRSLGYGGRESLGEIPQTPSAELRNATGDGVTKDGGIREARATHMPTGYKRTEAGVIPEDWSVQPLKSMLAEPPSYGINAPAVSYDASLPTYIRITDVSKDGRFRPTPRVSVNGAFSTRLFLRPGDLVLARTGASVGKSYLYDPCDGALVFAGFLIRITPHPSRLRPAYLIYYLQTQGYWDWVANNSARSGQPGINSREYGSLPVPLPPVAEQRAIAVVLSDVDALVGSLEALIAKKRAIKRAAMQQLLTGRTRLPGFEGAWKAVSLGVLAEIRNGGTPSTTVPDYWDGDIPWCTPTDITRTSGKELVATARSITSSGLDSCGGSLLPAGALLLCSRATIGELKIAAMPVATNQGFKSLVCGGSVNHEYLYYRLLPLKDEMAGLATGSTFLEISKRDVASIRIHLPQLAEQRAIANVLTDMDDEIAALERRLDKTRAVKQGMMQQLLTGAVRLPIPDDGLEGESHDA